MARKIFLCFIKHLEQKQSDQSRSLNLYCCIICGYMDQHFDKYPLPNKFDPRPEKGQIKGLCILCLAFTPFVTENFQTFKTQFANNFTIVWHLQDNSAIAKLTIFNCDRYAVSKTAWILWKLCCNDFIKILLLVPDIFLLLAWHV